MERIRDFHDYALYKFTFIFTFTFTLVFLRSKCGTINRGEPKWRALGPLGLGWVA